LTRNIPLMMEMQICTFFNPNLTWDEQFAPLMGEEEVENLKSKFLEMNVLKVETLRVSYGSMFPYPPPHSERLFFNLMEGIGSWPMDTTEYVLMSLTILFCPDTDMLDLLDRKTVEEIHTNYAVLLQKYLNKKHQLCPVTARARFTQGVTCLVRCRELHNIFTQ